MGPPPSLTWTPPPCCPEPCPSVESTPPWTPSTPPPVSWTPTLSELSTTRSPEVSRRSSGLQISSGYHCHLGYGRVVRGGQAQGRQSKKDRKIPFTAFPGR